MPPEPTTQPQPAADPTPAADGQPDALDALDAALGDGQPEGAPAEPAEWTPPSREEWEAAQAALEAERGKLKRARTQAQKLREGRTTPPQSATDPAPAAQDPQTEVWRDRAVRQAARAQLLERGADKEMVDLALGRLKAGEVDFDADEEPILDDWLDQMEERFPKLFAKATATPAGAPAPGRVNQAGAAARPPQRQLSLGEQIIANSETARTNATRFPRGRS